MSNRDKQFQAVAVVALVIAIGAIAFLSIDSGIGSVAQSAITGEIPAGCAGAGQAFTTESVNGSAGCGTFLTSQTSAFFSYGSCGAGQAATAVTTTTLACGTFLTTQTSAFFSYGQCTNNPYNQNFSNGITTTTMNCYAPMLAYMIVNPTNAGSGINTNSITYNGYSFFIWNFTGWTYIKLTIYDNNRCAVRLWDLTTGAALIVNNNTLASNRELSVRANAPNSPTNTLTNLRLDVALTSGQAGSCSLQSVILFMYN